MAARAGHDRLLRLQWNVVVEFWRALGLLVLSSATRNRARNLYRWRRGHRQTRGNVMDTVTCCECGHVGQRDNEHGRTFFEDVRGNWYCAGCALSSYKTAEERRADKAESRARNRLKAFLGMATERRINETIDQCRDETGWDLFKVPTPMHYQRKSVADYTGDNVSGQHIAIEAKSTKAKSKRPGSAASGWIASRGTIANLRTARRGCGIERRSSAHVPPSHSRMSASMGRGP